MERNQGYEIGLITGGKFQRETRQHTTDYLAGNQNSLFKCNTYGIHETILVSKLEYQQRIIYT